PTRSPPSAPPSSARWSATRTTRGSPTTSPSCCCAGRGPDTWQARAWHRTLSATRLLRRRSVSAARRGRHDAVQPVVHDQLAVVLRRVLGEGDPQRGLPRRQIFGTSFELRGRIGERALQRRDDRRLRRILFRRELVDRSVDLLAAGALRDELMPERDVT